MNSVLLDFIALLIWPGLIGGTLLAFFYMGLNRKLMARMQGRRGPSLLQAFYDFIKLMGKEAIVPAGFSPLLFYALPLVALAAVTCALGLLPAPGNPSTSSFPGDAIVLVYLLEVPALCDVIIGYASRSLYGEVSATREAVLSLGYNLPFLAAIVALSIQANSFRIRDIFATPIGPVHIVAALTFLLAVPARLRSNPFSIPNAEQEIIAGTHTEFNGAPLAILQLTEGLEIVALSGFLTALFVPITLNPLAASVLYLAINIVVVVMLTLLAASTARLKVRQAFRFYWTWGALASLVTFFVAIVW